MWVSLHLQNSPKIHFVSQKKQHQNSTKTAQKQHQNSPKTAINSTKTAPKQPRIVQKYNEYIVELVITLTLTPSGKVAA
jgi:hypothetical protein